MHTHGYDPMDDQIQIRGGNGDLDLPKKTWEEVYENLFKSIC